MRSTHLTPVRNDRGAIYVFAAMIMVVLLLAAGLVVDLGQQRVARRDAQALADVVALDMARQADGRKLSELRNSSGFAREALIESALRNGHDGHIVQATVGVYPLVLIDSTNTIQITVEWGWFSTNGENRCTYTDENGTPIPSLDDPVPAGSGWIDLCTNGNDVPNAVRVTVTGTVDFVFLPAGDGPSAGGVSRTSVARHGGEEIVSFRLGSYLLDGVGAGQLNTLLTRLLGAPVDLQAVHYDGLLRHDLTIRDVAAFHGITGSPGEVLNQQITMQQLAAATVDALRRENNGTLTEAHIQAIEAVFVNSGSTADGPIRLGDLVMADPTNPDSALDAEVAALDFLQSAAHLAQCSPDGTGNWDCHAAELAGLTADLAGVATVGAPQTQVIENPRVYVGNQIGATLETNQINSTVGLDFTSTPTGNVGNCTLLSLNCLISGLLGDLLQQIGTISIVGVGVTGQIDIGLVGGKASILDLCHNQPSRDLLLATTTSLYDVETRIDIRLENRVTTLLGGTTITPFTISLVVSNAQPTNTQNVLFTDPTAMGPETLGGGSVGLSGLEVQIQANGSPIGISQLDSLYTRLSNNLLKPTIDSLLARLTNTIVPRTDALVGELSDRLGINVTGADVAGRYVRCGDYGVQLVG